MIHLHPVELRIILLLFAMRRSKLSLMAEKKNKKPYGASILLEQAHRKSFGPWAVQLLKRHSTSTSKCTVKSKELHWHLEKAFLNRFPLTCLRTWCGCRLRCLSVSLQKSWLLENRQEKSAMTHDGHYNAHIHCVTFTISMHQCYKEQKEVGVFGLAL